MIKKNKMKKLVLIIIVGLFSAGLQAQSFGVQGGGVLSGILYANNQENAIIIAKTNLKPGFMAGITFDLPINENMFLNFGTGIKTLGATVIDGLYLHPDSTSEGILIKTNNIYLNATFNYKFSFDKIDVFAEGGAYSGYTISGKRIIKPKTGDNIESDLKIGSEETDDLLPIDFGYIIGAGIYLNKSVKFSVGYQHGLLNLTTAKEDRYGPVRKNRMGYITVAYMFNSK